MVAAQVIHADVCVYGGTSGGVIAAVQAARMGKTVALVVVNNHLGGMTSGGLGVTDVGNFGTSYIQGLAREFYSRVGQKYGTEAKFTFEPHVAEAVFDEMARQAGVAVHPNQHLVSVTMEGERIASITMNNSNVFQARMFIDASYEGDLMAKASVTYTVGREAVSQYGETFNGVRPTNSGGHQFHPFRVNPYLEADDPACGLLPLVQAGGAGTPGEADRQVQAYNFRLCLTRVRTNQLPITAPLNYSAAQYELLGRYIQAMAAKGGPKSRGVFLSILGLPNGKTDVNNRGPISTDYIGQSVGYVEADYDTRARIWQRHKDYTLGLLHFLATDARVPVAIRNQMRAYGLCKDEFVDNGGWSWQLYVREARRMVSDYVMTQSNCLGQVMAADSIGLAAYTMDSHNCQRVVVEGSVQNEGDVEVAVPSPFPIAYRSLVPRTGECVNLLVPWCLSASHIAFGSIRMEPVFMILGQSAATAACIAIDDQISVQKVNLAKLQRRLRADKQRLRWDEGAGNKHRRVKRAQKG